MIEVQNMEAKQLRILFGVCLLFVICHTCRIIRNVEDVYLRLIKGVDITERTSCNENCASTLPLQTHVSLVVLIGKN